jgi:hypothetical protein
MRAGAEKGQHHRARKGYHATRVLLFFAFLVPVIPIAGVFCIRNRKKKRDD